MKNVSMKQIIDIYENEIRKNTKNKRRIYQFEKYRMQNIIEIYHILQNFDEKYFCHYNIFLIREPKCRVIMSLNIKDKIINHYIARYILIQRLEKYFIDRNVATRKGMGTDYGRKLVKKYLNKNKIYEKFYILKIDISKYFYTIDHAVLKSLLKEKLEEDDYKVVSFIIDSSDHDYINEQIQKLMQKYHIELPFYEKGKGLPIGNMTSQFLAVFYLHRLDFEIVHHLKITSYIRYMDDFILIDPCKEKLKQALEYIHMQLENVYHLKLNQKKTKICDCKEGFVFLGYHYHVINNKVIMTLTNANKYKIRKMIKDTHWKYKKGYCTLEQAFSSVQCYLNNYHYGTLAYVKRTVERLWFDEFRK